MCGSFRWRSDMTKKEIKFCEWCATNNPLKFYQSSAWEKKRREVLRMDKYECQICKQHKKYTKATTVHHVNEFRLRPDLGLEIYYHDPAEHEPKRNLISLCHDCHEAVHGYRHASLDTEPLTEERWD